MTRRADNGQATVELALAMPLLCVLALGVVQLAMVMRDQIAAIEIARMAARAAAVATDPMSAAATAAAAARSDASVSTSIVGSTVTVEVSIVNSTDVPLIGAWLPAVELRSDASMLLEPP